MESVREDKARRGRREGNRRKVGSHWHNGDVTGQRVKRNGWVRFIGRTKRGTKIQTTIVARPAKHILVQAVFIFFNCSCETRGSGTRATGDRSVRGCDTPPPGEAAKEDAAGAEAGEAAEAGAGVVGGPFTSFRFRVLQRGQLAGTCHSFSAW